MPWMRGSRMLAAVFAGASFIGLAQPAPAAPPEDDDEVQVDLEQVRARRALLQFYEARGQTPAWTANESSSALDELLAAISDAGSHGLRPSDYHRQALRRAIDAGDTDATEVLATDAYLTLAAHLLGGRVDPISIEPTWTASRRERDLPKHLQAALEKGRIRASLAELEPNAAGYGVLKDALAMYHSAKLDGGWQPVPPGPILRLGDSGPKVAALRERLGASGLLNTGDDADSSEFDIELESAVAAFQRRLGLEPDGIVGPLTLGQLNRTPKDRIDQIRANLERWRWLPEDLGPRHIRVNIADFRLEARNRGDVERTHDVVVGRQYRKTPVFSAEMSYVVFNPWWETPPSIARQDKLPAFRQDPQSVTRLGFEILDRSGKRIDPATIDWDRYSARDFPFRLRQQPGPQNALGEVKMMFPNPHNVYLHDTPSRELFGRTERAFSSGCVRVRDPIALSEWVLQQTPSWTPERIEKVLKQNAEVRVNLAHKIPVHILYFTSVSEPDGSLRLINDVYGRDAPLIAALGTPPPR